MANVSALEPAIDRPTAAVRLESTPLLAARYAGSSREMNDSHLYVEQPALPQAGLYQSL